MARTTITEALAEIKTITKRIESKALFINEHAWRQEAFKDTLIKDGGSAKIIVQERQAMDDLYKRIVNIRQEIANTNSVNSLKIGEVTMLVSEWLIWRRDVAPHMIARFSAWRMTITKARRDAQLKGFSVVKGSEDSTSINDVVINIDEFQLSKDIEQIETALGELDGRLSLFNATTTFEV